MVRRASVNKTRGRYSKKHARRARIEREEGKGIESRYVQKKNTTQQNRIKKKIV